MPESISDMWKYYDITHRRHVLCNPTCLAKVDDVISLLDLRPADRVVDIACGKGELLVRLVERYGVSVVGVDKSPYCIDDIRRKLQDRALGARAELLHMDGAAYRADPPESFALASCVGASWVFGGHRGTLRALAGMTRPGGYVLAGEIFWRKEPDPKYLEADGMTREDCALHFENVRIGEEEGLVPLYAAVSSEDDWDRYVTLQWHAVAEWAAANPDDPDRLGVRERVAHERDVYLRWQRDTLGWGLYLFGKPR